jgi:hypothetical protein
MPEKTKLGPKKNYKELVFSPFELFVYKLAGFAGQKEMFYRLYSLMISEMMELRQFKNKHRGERCFIIGGGPSLLKLDPEPLSKEITFGVNSIFLIFEWLHFQPTYYVVEDWFVYEDRFDHIRKSVTESRCFFPIQFSTENFDRPNNQYFRAIYEFEEKPGWPNFSKDIAKLIWIGGTVTYVCLQIAYYMGFNTVYLLGMDHNYSRQEHVIADGTSWVSGGDDPNHFHPQYFGQGYRWHDPDVKRMEKAYKKANQNFCADGRKIFNATVGGKLEVFDRINYDKIFSVNPAKSKGL